MQRKDRLVLMGDFETSVFKNQTFTQVWASGLVKVSLQSDIKDCIIHNNIYDTFEYLFNLKRDVTVFYHNLKFDGTFILNYLENNGFTFSYKKEDGHIKRNNKKYMMPRSYNTFISDMGQWYSITVKTPQNHTINFCDSLKILPFSVADIGKAFKTKYQKSVINYVGERFEYGEITQEERDYLARDLLVPAHALAILFEKGMTKLTIGSNALNEYREICKLSYFNGFFDRHFKNLENFESPVENMDTDTYIRNSYVGGWCYVKKLYQGVQVGSGCVADVNSLYPSVMQDKNNTYPVGNPHNFYKAIPKMVLENPQKYYFFVRVKTRFYLKDKKLPFLHIRGTPYYKATENLETSDILIKDKYYKKIITPNGELEAIPILTLTQTDFYLLQKHYNLVDFEILDGIYFRAVTGNFLFGEYIEKWSEVKKTSKGATRTLAKLMLNNLYGKFATNKSSNWKLPHMTEGVLEFEQIKENDKKLISIAIGSAITAHARYFTIKAAQKNYHAFMYADTDSIHCTCKPSELKGVAVHPSNFNCWKIENEFDFAIFTRQKTYIEHNIIADGEPCKPYYNIKCAGMNKKCKDLLRLSLRDESITLEEFKEKYISVNEEQLEFIKEKRTIADFKKGLKIYGKLLPKIIKGGTVLEETYFTLN